MSSSILHHPSFGMRLAIGMDALDELEGFIEGRDLERVLVITGRSSAADRRIIDPIRRTLGSRLASIHVNEAGKTFAGLAAAVEAIRVSHADAVLGLGSGTSLDVARQANLFSDTELDRDTFITAYRSQTLALQLPLADAQARPVIVVPITLAGADIATGGKIEFLSRAEAADGIPIRIAGVMPPTLGVYDPSLFGAVPTNVLLGSAMNGLSKGIETIYSRGGDALADATAIHGTRLFCDGILRLGTGSNGCVPVDLIEGLVLMQLHRRASVIHAFGHALTRQAQIQQGLVHAVVAPAVLRFILDRIPARRDLIARALGIQPFEVHERTGDAIISRLVGIRDHLGLPARLRDIIGAQGYDLAQTARITVEDPFMTSAPEGLEMTESDVEQILTLVW